MKQIFLLAILPLALFSRDFQYWAHQSNRFELCKNVHLGIEETWRFDRNATRLYQSYIEAGLLLTMEKGMLIAFKYRQDWRRGEIFETPWQMRQIPIFDMIKTWEREIVNLTNRSRLEFRVNDHFWTYRNRLTVHFLKMHKRIQPYVAEEFFFRRLQEFHQNRFEVGVNWEMGKEFIITTAYILRNKKERETWSVDDVLMTRLHFNF